MARQLLLRCSTSWVHPVALTTANSWLSLQNRGRQEALSGFKDAINTGSARSWLVPAGILAYCLTDHRTGAVKRILKKHRRLFTTGVLFAFVLAWVVPAQACFASGGPGAQSECPGCAAPYACDSGHCGTSVHASCGASMAPTATVSPQSLDKFAQAPALLNTPSARPLRPDHKQASLPEPVVYRPTTSINIRFCVFLI